jgi:hypothetical protein
MLIPGALCSRKALILDDRRQRRREAGATSLSWRTAGCSVVDGPRHRRCLGPDMYEFDRWTSQWRVGAVAVDEQP